MAQKIEKDHAKLTEELKMYASEHGWLIPAGELKEDIQKRQAMYKKTERDTNRIGWQH